MTKIEELNKMQVTDWSCSGGEIEYISVENNEENRGILRSLGATDEDIKEMAAGSLDEEDLDITFFAFNIPGVIAWQKDNGFMNVEQVNVFEVANATTLTDRK